MRLITGLGNIGDKYLKTRHNIGFMVVDAFARTQGLEWEINRGLTCYLTKKDDLVLVKSTTLMNRSGGSVQSVRDFYKIEAKNILVVHDDLDLDFGGIRLVFDGSSAGHKGVESIVESLGSFDFGRLRVGIGHPRNLDSRINVESYVLREFSDEEKKQLPLLIERCVAAVNSYLEEGMMATMNRYN